MRILVSSDYHIGVTSFGVIGDDGANSRLTDVESTLHRIVDFAIDQDIDLFVCAGDVFHTNRPPTHEQIVFWGILKRLIDAPFLSRFIIGNHDYSSRLGQSHALALFSDFLGSNDNVKIYDETTWEMIDDHLFCWFPFAGEEPDMLEISRHAPRRTFLVCHSHLEGATVGAEPFEIKTDKATKFRDLPVDGVFAGHFHKPQLLADNPLAFYPGSIQPVDFSERMDVKGVVIVDTEELTLHPAGFKTRTMIQFDIERPHMVASQMYAVKDSIIKVNVTLDESEAHKFDETGIRSILMDAGAHSIASINLKVNRTQVTRDPDIKIDSDVRSNFIRYLKQKDYGDLTEQISETGCDIIRECAQ